MARRFEDIKVLLVQARGTPDMQAQEQECFLERCRISREQLLAVNVLHDKIHPELLSGVDVLMIGGAGEYSATKDYPWMEDVLNLVQFVDRNAFPTFGSCWGHQVIARALGGEVVHDSERAELGCHAVSLTEAGTTDRLFVDFPREFLANMGHHDRVSRLPESATELAFNKSQRFQAFCITDKPIYSTQFHSELDARRERERLYRYRIHYPEMHDEDTFQAIVASLAETTDVDHLLFDFLSKFALDDSV